MRKQGETNKIKKRRKELKKGAVLLVAGLLMLTMCAVVSASEVGNITFLEEKESGLRLGLHVEHSTRQMKLKESATLAGTTCTSEYEDDYRSGSPVSGDTGYVYYDIYSNWVTFNLTGLEEIETIDRYFLKASLNLGSAQVYGKFGVARLISKWEHWWGVGLLGYEEIYGGEYYIYDGEEWQLEDSYEYIYGYEYDMKEENPSELGLELSDWGTFYGGGLKLIFHDTPDFKAALDAQYGYQKNKTRGFFSFGGSYREWAENCETYDDYTEVGIGQRIDESETTEIHVALVLSGKMGKLSPYGGLKFSNMTTKYKGQFFAWGELPIIGYEEFTLSSFEYTMIQQDTLGMFFGATYDFTPALRGMFEARIGDETAFSTGLEVKV